MLRLERETKNCNSCCHIDCLWQEGGVRSRQGMVGSTRPRKPRGGQLKIVFRHVLVCPQTPYTALNTTETLCNTLDTFEAPSKYTALICTEHF